MPYIPASGIVMANIRATLFSQMIENTLYFEPTEDPNTEWSSTELDSLGQKLFEWIDVELQPLLSVSTTVNEAYLTDLTTATSLTHTEVVGLTGLKAGTCSPSNVTITTTFRTNGRGRSSRGRNYWLGVPETEVTGNTIATAYLADIRNAYIALNSYVADAARAPRHVVLSRYFEGSPRLAALPQVVTSYVHVDANIDSQRRRLTGRGQ